MCGYHLVSGKHCFVVIAIHLSGPDNIPVTSSILIPEHWKEEVCYVDPIRAKYYAASDQVWVPC